MKIYVTRDSVAAGDDVDAPHGRTYSLADTLSPMEIIARIVADGYLARISGGEATWSVASGVLIAVVAQQWKEARSVAWPEVALAQLEQRDGAYRVHFNYHMQREPEEVLAILKELTVHAL